MEGLPYEILPQREARTKRRRKEPAAGAGDAAAAASSDAAGAAAATLPGIAAPPLPPRATGGASSSSGGGGGLPVMTHIDCPEYRTSAVGSNKFEYLDHTADVQLHAWGATLGEAFANAALAMFNYMTPLEGVSIDPELTRTYEAEGHDLHSLLYAFLDELLFVFSTELFVCKELEVTAIDREGWRMTAVGRGELFVRGRHEAGTEVKAITYSAMQVRETPGDCEVFVIVDI